MTLLITNPPMPWLAKRNAFYFEKNWQRSICEVYRTPREKAHSPRLRNDTVSRVWTDNHKTLLWTLETMSWGGCTVRVESQRVHCQFIRMLKLLGEGATEQNNYIIFFYPWYLFIPCRQSWSIKDKAGKEEGKLYNLNHKYRAPMRIALYSKVFMVFCPPYLQKGRKHSETIASQGNGFVIFWRRKTIKTPFSIMQFNTTPLQSIASKNSSINIPLTQNGIGLHHTAKIFSLSKTLP